MNKVVRVALISKTQRDGEEVPYKDICRVLWDLQRETREVKNKTIQQAWEWHGFSNDFKAENGEYPKPKDFLKNGDGNTYSSLNGFVYDKLKADYSLNSANLSTTTRSAAGDFSNALKDVLRGDKSIISYRSNQPIDLHNKNIKLTYDRETNKFSFELSVLNKAGKAKYGFSKPLVFEAIVKDKSTRTILERCFDDIYGISASQLLYNQKKKQWCLNLSYSFEAKRAAIDEDKILGVDLRIIYPITASVNGDKSRLFIGGDEIEQFRRKVEARRVAIKKQRVFCGDGSIGHGYDTRLEPALKIGDKIARFRDTYNHKVSRTIIDYAVKNGCGTIQLEKLTGIGKDAEPFIKNWSYFDLQTKIEYKAKEQGIKIVYINPQFTSQRCCKCGNINAENIQKDRFVCTECGFKENTFYNASQNIALKDIDKIIQEQINGAKDKPA